MINFNDNNVVTGYIKQLLHTFNLPSLRVYKEDTFLYDKGLYVKDNYICSYNATNNQIIPLLPFNYNKPILNYTKNLKITNTFYDSHTHEYLGEYLRFLRDYKHLDLMSMYNCFSNNICTNLNINNKYVFDSNDNNYKIYMLPVKCGAQYTIALDTDVPIELVCGLYKKNLYGFDKNEPRATPKIAPIGPSA